MPDFFSPITLGTREIVQVLILALAYYYLFVFFKGTRGVQILLGLVMCLFFMVFVTHVFRLDELNYVLRQISVYLVVGIMVIFQPEIRRALAELGRQPSVANAVQRRTAVDHIVQAVAVLSEQRVGALIAVEREIGTRPIMNTGVALDAEVNPELLASLFFPHTPLHDGGVVIQNNRIVAAGCVFPLSQKLDLHRSLGTRHRAAVGMSEETDAVVVVVSEETGTVSVCFGGRLNQGMDGERLRRFLEALLVRKTDKGGSRFQRMQKKLDLTPGGIAKSDELAKEDSHE